MRVEYHPDTVSDLNRAVDYLEAQRRGLGIQLRLEIYQTIDRILSSPQQYRVVRGEVRRCFVRRFPFSILYSIVSDEAIRILVVRHHRQRASYGSRRR
jgi:plasmid stabilization system protein ParE